MAPKKAAKGKKAAAAAAPAEDGAAPAAPAEAAPPPAEAKKEDDAEALKAVVEEQKKQQTDLIVELCIEIAKNLEKTKAPDISEEDKEKLSKALKLHGDVKKPVQSIKMPIIKFAVALECPQLVAFFIKKGADYLSPNEYGCTLLHMTETSAIIHLILEKIKSKEERENLINHPNNRGVTPFHLAVFRKDYTTIKYLLQNGADPNIISPAANKNAYEMFPKDETMQKLFKKFTKKKFTED